MSKSNFNKFIKKDDKGSKLKERIRQEKKKARQDTKEYFAQQKLQHTSNPTGPKKSASDLITKKGRSDKPLQPAIKAKDTGEMPLNKFVAHAGVCSRRDAADLVKT